MKQFVFAWAAILSFILAGRIAAAANAGAGATTPTTDYEVIERGANHRVWQRTTYETMPDGSVVPHLHRYTELATGLEYQQNGQWVDSVEQIEASPQGAVAQQGQFQVIFSNNLNSTGAIDQQTPDGKRLSSNILGLAYYDAASKQSVLIAQVQDSQGKLISANQVLYPNAFTGVSADVRYTYRMGSFEQDVILRAQPPSPESLGLNPDTTEIEVLTEFLDPPAATVTEHQSQFYSLPDDDIVWGATGLGHGNAFDLGESANRQHKTSVRRQLLNLSGRTILIEGVPLQKIQLNLSALPLQSSRQTKLPVVAAKTLRLPKTPLTISQSKPMQMAANLPPAKGYVLDYVTVTSETNFTFQGDTTYYVSGNYSMLGTTTIEGGTVIKMGGSGSVTIFTGGAIECNTSTYRPGVFTSVNDDSIGESISGSSGNPGLDVNCYLNLDPTNIVLNNLRFSYGWIAINQGNEGVPAILNIWDSQFMNVDIAASAWNVGLHNVLLGKSAIDTAAVCMGGPSLVAENVTADGTNGLLEADYGAGATTAALTNCLITGQPIISSAGWDTITFATNSVGWLPSPAGPVYQVVGGGNYYLTNNSPWHNAGTTNISLGLLADIADKTTYPPVVYSNLSFSIATNFNPQAYRDYAGNPDLGYHYDPLDYVFGGVNAYSNLTFTAGTAVGWFYPGAGASFGISLHSSAQANFAGLATAPCEWARNNMVQEGGNGYWTAGSYLGGFIGQGGNYTAATAPTVNFDFTRAYAHNANDAYSRDYGDGTLLVINANNSEFYSGLGGGYLTYLNFTNCLAVRASLWASCNCSPQISMVNGTFYGGSLQADHWSGVQWPVTVENCAFAGVNLTGINDTSGGNTNLTWINFNSYLTTDSLPAGQGSQYVTVTNYNWESSWFGNFYLPPNSPVIQRGSTTADKVGLYHFTTQTNQVPETNAIVDIGYHYVATDQYGNPLDSNGDGIPDYLEDPTGHGLPLSITLVAPTSSTVYAEPANVGMQATIFDWSGSVTNVTFFNGSTNVGVVATAPYNFTWPVIPYGTYTVMAQAYDNKGATALSLPASITVTNRCGE